MSAREVIAPVLSAYGITQWRRFTFAEFSTTRRVGTPANAPPGANGARSTDEAHRAAAWALRRRRQHGRAAAGARAAGRHRGARTPEEMSSATGLPVASRDARARM